MKLLILHGDDQVTSRTHFDQERDKFQGEVLSFDGKSLTSTELIQALESPSFFDDQRALFIENLIETGSKEAIKVLLDRMANLNTRVILWEKKKLSQTKKNLFKNAIIKEFPLPKIIFKYLDSIKPTNQQSALKFLQKAIKQHDAQYVCRMLIWHFRHLLLVTATNFDDYYPLDPWKVKRLKSQMSLFPSQKLGDLYRQLLTIDLNQKTGAQTTLEQDLIFFTIAATST